MQIYKKSWCTFGIIHYIYYSKYEGYTLVFKDNVSKSLLDCNIDDFTYNADKRAFQYAIELYNKSLIGENKYVIYGDIEYE